MKRFVIFSIVVAHSDQIKQGRFHHVEQKLLFCGVPKFLRRCL
jgi:hypothetical protein